MHSCPNALTTWPRHDIPSPTDANKWQPSATLQEPEEVGRMGNLWNKKEKLTTESKCLVYKTDIVLSQDVLRIPRDQNHRLHVHRHRRRSSGPCGRRECLFESSGSARPFRARRPNCRCNKDCSRRQRDRNFSRWGRCQVSDFSSLIIRCLCHVLHPGSASARAFTFSV